MGTEVTPRRWTRVKFCDVVRDVKESERDPKSAGITRYVGLEHLEPECLRLASFGDLTSESVSFTKLFRKGQVLFGKRRAYQRKVAVADFGGICSSDILTFEPKNGDLISELLPFIVQSDAFFDYAIDTSSGSLSPRTRWSQLKDFEFQLPPETEQRRIADLLIAAEDDFYCRREIVERLGQLMLSTLTHFFPRKPLGTPKTPNEVELQSLCAEPITYGIVQAGPNVEDGVPYIRVSDMVGKTLTLEGMLRTAPEIAERFKRSEVRAEEIVFALRGEPGLVRIVPAPLDGANLTQGTARIAVRQDVSRDYVLWAIRSPRVTQQVTIEAKGSTFKEITLKSIRALKIPTFEVEKHNYIAQILNELSDGLEKAELALASSDSLRKELRESILMGGRA